jgi:hypothetical protein
MSQGLRAIYRHERTGQYTIRKHGQDGKSGTYRVQDMRDDDRG